MASFNYFIVTKSKSNPTPIYARFKLSQETDLKVNTGLTIQKEDWSKAKQQVKSKVGNEVLAEERNVSLDGLKKQVWELYNKDLPKGVTINRLWLENALKTGLNQPTNNDDKRYYLVDYAKHFIEISKNRRVKGTAKKVSHRTIQDYNTTVRNIERFQTTETLPKIKLTDFNTLMYFNFLGFLLDKLKLKDSTAGGDISNIKFFLKNAEREGYNVCQDYKSGDFVEPKNKSIDTYLNRDEIDRIFNYQFNNERLDNARDWFIIGLWTGFRVSDLLKLNLKEHLKDDFFEKENYKTGIPTVVPVHEQVTATLKKRNDSLPRKISDQKFNDYVKEVCKIVGINQKIEGAKKEKTKITYPDKSGKLITVYKQRKQKGTFLKHELISSHTCRRSFATNHYGRIDTLTLMNITGHRTERQFLEYVKITPREHANKLKELWKKLSTTH